MLTNGKTPQEILVCVKMSLSLLAVNWRLISLKGLMTNQKLLLDAEYPCFEVKFILNF